MVARAKGAQVVAVDPSTERREAAIALGCVEVIDPVASDVVGRLRDVTGGEGVAASIDAAGVEPALTAALRSTRPDGQIVVVAHHHDPYPLRSGHIIFGEVRVTGSLIYDSDDFRAVIAAMAAGVYPSDGWTDVIGMDAVGDGLESLRTRSSNKLLVRVGV
jgi:(R,R)-butanediol dehydrogenase / meso-butanediol dehydrogenase / diacetyl reductase